LEKKFNRLNEKRAVNYSENISDISEVDFEKERYERSELKQVKISIKEKRRGKK